MDLERVKAELFSSKKNMYKDSTLQSTWNNAFSAWVNCLLQNEDESFLAAYNNAIRDVRTRIKKYQGNIDSSVRIWKSNIYKENTAMWGYQKAISTGLIRVIKAVKEKYPFQEKIVGQRGKLVFAKAVYDLSQCGHRTPTQISQEEIKKLVGIAAIATIATIRRLNPQINSKRNHLQSKTLG